jgi:hypothetical protein
MKKLKREAELFKAAMLAGVKYAEGRGVVEFEATDSASEKLLYIYRLLVHDKVIQALPEDQVAEKSLRHKLAIWYAKQLPKDHPPYIPHIADRISAQFPLGQRISTAARKLGVDELLGLGLPVTQ